MAANKPINSTDVAKSIGDAIRRHLERADEKKKRNAALRQSASGVMKERNKEGKNIKQRLPGDTRPLLRIFPFMAKRAQVPAPTPLLHRHRPRNGAWSPTPQSLKRRRRDRKTCLRDEESAGDRPPSTQTRAQAAISIGWLNGVGHSATYCLHQMVATQVLTSV